MIVVSIIAVLAAIAIPTLLRSRNQAQYQTAWYTMRTIQSAENASWTQHGVYADFDTLRANGFIDNRFHGTDTTIKGYDYKLFLGTGSLSFSCIATSQLGDGLEVTLDESGAIH